ncbi:MAG: hypothetical protein IMY67_11795 [Bacteroidetes bacterium]|nr:hypothetical protein [Bacteroidota bacterium]
MKQQLLPLFLCVFTTITVWSSTLIDTEKTNPENFLNTDYVSLAEFTSSANGLIKGYSNSLINSQNSSVINEVFYYDSQNLTSSGISLNKEFSYNLIRDEKISSATSYPALHINSNLFSQGLFYGFALTVVLLNLVCFFIFDETLFVYFAATLAAFTSAFFFAEGLFALIGIDSLAQTEIIQSTFLLVGIGLSALFASKFLTVKDFYPKLNHITVPLLVISTILISTAWIIGDSFIAHLANTLLFGLISIYFLTGVMLFSRKNYAKFYVIASFVPLLFSIDFFVLQNFGIDFLFTETVHLKVAALFEALLLSYAIMYRMQAVKEEGVLRQTEMRIFLKRQDVMNRSKVEEMIEDIYLENLIMQYDLDGLEIKLLQYISEGKSNLKIARKLKLTESEVGEHTKDLYQKLEISEHIQEDYRMVDNQPDFIYN